MTTTAEYRYTLPGDELRVQAAAYAWGMCALIQIASHFHLGELSDAYITIPRDRSDIEGFAQELATKTVNSPERNTEAPITNSPELYIEECVIGFTEGYLFGLFAMYRNLMDLLSPPETFHIALAFALELKLKESAVPEPEDEYDERILNGVERLKLIYKQYRRLNQNVLMLKCLTVLLLLVFALCVLVVVACVVMAILSANGINLWSGSL